MDHNKLWKILQETGIPNHLTCLLRNLHAGQEVPVRSGHGTTNRFKTGKGVSQDCIVWPTYWSSMQSSINFCSAAQSCLTLRPHGLPHTRLPYPSPSPGACSNSCPLSQWCHPTILSSVVPSSCFQSFPASGSFSHESALRIRWPKYWSFSFSISPSNEYSGLISFRISLLFKGHSRVFSNTTVQKHHFFGAQHFYSITLTSIHDHWKNHSLD